MDQVYQLALQFGQGKLTEFGIKKAMEILNLNQPDENIVPETGISIGGINLNPKDMILRAGLKKAMTGGSLSGIMGPAALLGGAIFLGNAFNPLNPKARNYSPNLAGQIDYLSGQGMIGRNVKSNALQYGPGSVLRGKNVISGFGTNNYQIALDKFINKLQERKDKGKKINDEMLEKALKEKGDFFEYKADIRDRAKTTKPKFEIPTGKDIHGGGNAPKGVDAGTANVQDFADIYSYGGRVNYSKGGIASLWPR